MAEYKVIDVSKHNGNIDFQAVKNAGVYAVIIRAGYGREVSQKDPMFEINYAAAKAAGLHIGAYWYSYATAAPEADREAAACLACIQGKEFDFPVYYDLEEEATADLGKDTCTQIAQTFCTAMEQAGYWAGIYANTNWFTNYLDHAALSSRFTIWLADYRAYYNTTLKRDMHQYTSTGRVAGVNGNVDLDRCTRDFPAEIGSLYGAASTTESAPTQSTSAAVAHCTGDRVNIRDDAHTAATVLTQANKGDALTWLADDGWGWSKVQRGSVTGWMSNKYIDKTDVSAYKVGAATGDRVNIRSGPGTSYAVLRQVNKGNLFDIICILPGKAWYQVDVAGTVGYISSKYVAIQ